MKSIKIVLTISLLAFASGSVFAACGGKGDMKMPTLADIDANSDGKISEQEFNDFRSERMKMMAEMGKEMKHKGEMPGFADIDSDGDGFMSEQELTTHQAAHRAKMKEKMAQKEAQVESK